MTLLITGGAGFLGRRLIEALRRDDREILALSRSEAADRVLRNMGVKPLRGDLNGSALTLPPIEAVVHAAAHFRLAGPRAPFFSTNVEGTKALLRAAKVAGASRFVAISAAAVVMDERGSPLRQVDESSKTFADSPFPYIASKAQGEAAVLAADAPGFRTLALRPPGIWGHGDAFSKALRPMLARRQFGFINAGRYPYVTCHVDNVVEAVLCALATDVGGRAYFINDSEPTTFRAFVEGLAEALGLDASRSPSMPYGVARGVGAAMETLWSMVGAKADPPMSRTMVRLIGREFTTSDAAARRDLGYVGRTTRAEGLATYA